MSAVDSGLFDIHLLNFPDGMGKLVFPSRSNETHENKGVSSIPADILETPKHYTFFMDVPGLSKSDIQVLHILHYLCNCLMILLCKKRWLILSYWWDLGDCRGG